jgi:GT2 family glycosyltransferase
VFRTPGENTGLPPAPGEVFLILSDRNGGYSYGNNLGIKLAKSFDLFSYLLILNNDTVLRENFLEEMTVCHESLRVRYNNGKTVLGATELGEDGRLHHHAFHYLHLPTGITFFKPVWPSFRYIVGACIFTGISAPLQDEKFFLYFDDAQYSKILLREGYRLESCDRSVFIHEVGGTSGEKTQSVILKSLLRFYWLHYPILLVIVLPIRILLLAYLWIKKLQSAFS